MSFMTSNVKQGPDRKKTKQQYDTPAPVHAVFAQSTYECVRPERLINRYQKSRTPSLDSRLDGESSLSSVTQDSSGRPRLALGSYMMMVSNLC
jgi:hypothetical protein